MTLVEGRDVIAIPVGYYREFRSDPLDALLKYGSLPMRARAPWFTNLQTIQNSLVLPDLVCGPKAELVDPVVGHRALIGAPYREDDAGSATILLDGILPEYSAADDGYWHVHFDYGLGKKRQGDAAGIAMGRITETYEERMLDPVTGNEYSRVMRTYEVPLVAQIVAPVSDQIYLSSIVRFILQLRQLRGFNITSFSSDQFQSASAGQELTLAGLVTAGMTIDPYTGEVTGLPKPFSVAGSDAAYREYLETINEGRLRLPQYELLRKEMRELEVVGTGSAPDHPATGSKETTDSVAGVVGYLGMFGHAVLDVGDRYMNRADLEQRFGIDAPTSLGPEGDIDESWFDFESDRGARLSVE